MPGRSCGAPTIKAIGLVLDTFHTFARKTDLKPMRSIPGDKIFLVQVADAPWLDMDVLSWSRHFRNFPGQGDLPVVDFMEAVQATELCRRRCRLKSSTTSSAQARRAMSRSTDCGRCVYLMDQMRERTGRAEPGLPAMPPRSRCLGIEFIEFAADEQSVGRPCKALQRAWFSQCRQAQIQSR